MSEQPTSTELSAPAGVSTDVSAPAGVPGEVKQKAFLRAISLPGLLGLFQGWSASSIAALEQLLQTISLPALLTLLPDIKALIASFTGTEDATSVKAQVVAALTLLRDFASLTPDGADSEAVTTINSILNQSTVLDGFCSLVADLLVHVPRTLKAGDPCVCTEKHVGDVVNGQQTELFKAAAINWANVAALAQEIFAIIMAWKNPTPAST